MAANFNNAAWFYDGLSRLVYGRALVKAQVYLLQFVPENANVLIVGGGTGWILDELTRLHPEGLTITYVEVAAAMMARSEKRDKGSNAITFINDAVENISMPAVFDAVITPFLLDNFKEENLIAVFGAINKLLKGNGAWLNASFNSGGKWWQKILLKTMFVFFRVVCGIEASQLPAIDECFRRNDYQLIAGRFFYSGFISAKAYRKGSS